MSSLIEQAIIDAKELREAALLTAESQIVEKYAGEIREAMSSLLEQEPEEEDPLGGDELGAGLEMGAEEAEAEDVEGVPDAAMGAANLCPCPDSEEDVEMEFTLDDLKKIADEMEAGAPEEQEELVADLAEGVDLVLEEEEIDLSSLEEGLDEGCGDLDEGCEEEIEFGEPTDLDAIVEELSVKIMDGDFTGWAGRPEADRQYQEEINLARLAATDAQEKNKDLQAGMKRLALKYESLEAKNTKLADTVIALKEKLDEVTLYGAKLLFQNEALTNTSLNRRQKKQFVEAIRRAESVNDAKVIYETLQSTVPAGRKTSAPESLNEAIRRPSHTIPRREAMHPSAESEEKRRFQLLAGIQSNK